MQDVFVKTGVCLEASETCADGSVSHGNCLIQKHYGHCKYFNRPSHSISLCQSDEKSIQLPVDNTTVWVL